MPLSAERGGGQAPAARGADRTHRSWRSRRRPRLTKLIPATIRPALAADGEHLSGIDRATWSPAITPAESADRPFLDRGVELTDVLVAVLDGVAVGYVTLGSATPLASNAHVLAVLGLAVAPAYQRRGIGRQLLAGVIEEARLRSARRLRLRVLATNHPARELYASVGFQIEGILRNEFLLDGRYIDDVLMAIWIGPRIARA